MEMPQDVETMRHFLGLINYLNRFSPCLAELNDPSERYTGRKWISSLQELARLHFNAARRK